MTDDAKLRKQASAGRRISALKDSAELDDAFDTVRDAYVKAWARTMPEETESRERLWAAVNALDRLRHHLTVVIKSGELAQRQLDELKG